MNKLEEFKNFAKTKPFLKEKVSNGETTWQELYERYDIYGPDDETFLETIKEEVHVEEDDVITEDEKEKKETDKEGLGSILGVLASIDTEKISEGLNGMKKILNVLSEVTKVDEPPIVSKRKMSRPYSRDDD